jgi:DNA-directed RNA polymerase subunit K/omega
MSDDEDIVFVENTEDMYGEDAEEVAVDADVDDVDEEREYATANVREILVLDDDMRLTSDKVSIFEYTEIVGIRAEQIARFDNCFVSIEGLTDPIKMAEREFSMRKCPLKIRREVGFKVIDGKPHKVIEYIDPNIAIHPSKSIIDDKF